MSIRKFVAAAVAAVALSAGAAHAETALSYYINGQVDWADIDAGPGDDNFTNVGVNGSVAVGLSRNVGAQFDLGYTALDNDLGNDDVFAGTAHLFHRTASGLIGGFLGAASVDGDTTWGGGVEAAKYAGDFTIDGALTLATNDDTDTDLWAVNGGVTYFYTDNLATSFGLGFGNVDFAVGDTDFWTVNVGVAYQLSNTPVGFTARLAYFDEDDINVDGTVLSLGVNYVFSGESLKARNRTGASQGGFLSNVLAGIL